MCNLWLYDYFKFSIQSVGYVVFCNTAASLVYERRNFQVYSWTYDFHFIEKQYFLRDLQSFVVSRCLMKNHQISKKSVGQSVGFQCKSLVIT